MIAQRWKDHNWTPEGTYPGAQLAVLMDLRDELKALNGLLHCGNFVGIPRSLKAIRKNTTRTPRQKVTARTHLLAKRRAA